MSMTFGGTKHRTEYDIFTKEHVGAYRVYGDNVHDAIKTFKRFKPDQTIVRIEDNDSGYHYDSNGKVTNAGGSKS